MGDVSLHHQITMRDEDFTKSIIEKLTKFYHEEIKTLNDKRFEEQEKSRERTEKLLLEAADYKMSLVSIFD